MAKGIDVPIFPGRPADRRTVDRRRLERAAVGAQLERWRLLRSNPTYRRGTIAILEERRAARPDLAQFESVDNDGSDTFVVSGQLLIRAQDLDDHARAALVASGLVASASRGSRATSCSSTSPTRTPGWSWATRWRWSIGSVHRVCRSRPATSARSA